MDAISNAYVELFVEILRNKIGDEAEEKVNEFVRDTEFSSPMNIRENDNTMVCNSADTDRAILENATDMAALLATTKGFISPSIEFDIVNKGLVK